MRKFLALAAVLALVACASQGDVQSKGPGMRSVELRNGPAPATGARYDKAAGTCRDPATQQMTSDQFADISRGWSETKKGGACSGPVKKKTPATTGYPERFAKLQRAGSAQVLVLLERDGRVAAAHAVCATDVEFGQAAVATALAIEYEPDRCDGQPVRSAFLLPLDYDWK